MQNDHANKFHTQDPALLKIKGEVYMPMIDTAEVVAKRYGISRERQDEYSLESQRRVAAAQQGGKFNDELARDHHHDGRRRQGDRRDLVQGSDAVKGRRPAAGHLGRRASRG